MKASKKFLIERLTTDGIWIQVADVIGTVEDAIYFTNQRAERTGMSHRYVEAT